MPARNTDLVEVHNTIMEIYKMIAKGCRDNGRQRTHARVIYKVSDNGSIIVQHGGHRICSD
jgi:hypothetical protein